MSRHLQQIHNRLVQEAREKVDHLTKQIERHDETIRRLSGTNLGYSVDGLIAHANENKIAACENLVKAQAELKEVSERDPLDIRAELRENAAEASLKGKKTAERKKAAKTAIVVPSAPAGGVKEKRQTYHYDGPSMYEQRREYSYFMLNASKLPSNLRRKLDSMPNNRGFLYHGIAFFGALIEEAPADTVRLTDKRRDANGRDVYVEHEYTPRGYTITESYPRGDCAHPGCKSYSRFWKYCARHKVPGKEYTQRGNLVIHHVSRPRYDFKYPQNLYDHLLKKIPERQKR